MKWNTCLREKGKRTLGREKAQTDACASVPRQGR
ncbi:MAG: hypothetical protein AVDCRST_MAG56-7196 [uncultured Cytophagales bacterium]|uniref:Uncharacterized protein n=1 Tax=uncultured Cytophagales bacterium TaxID=158755 RepID=A0A6J4LAF3_9SPHI|nr:MAG: hypothetical protein AVDCRST_MAG56-7196 [uncultured Cytophagales bacterium]